jgi:protocatechuate 3,4-dioxygenase beta subunit
MQRRKFIKDASAVAFGIGVFGNISWAKERFIGDTPTTTDILGPFYRPGAPLRQNLNPKDFKGEILHLSGTIFKEDGKTPMSDCLIEVWQCQADGLYDNLSDQYVYRGSQKVTADGKYHFLTTKPIPYPVEGSSTLFRPAHIHLRISAIGQQDLITQIYFAGDPHLDSDPSTKSALSVNRILSIRQKNSRESEIRFDIVLKKEYLPDDAVFQKVSGIYKMNNNSMIEFYRDGDLLYFKINNQIWGGLSYAGNNTFTGGVNDTEARFELLPQGKANVQFRFIRRSKTELEGTKVLVYEKHG